MISSVSGASMAYLQQAQAPKAQQQPTAKPAQQEQDSVQLSAHAKAAMSQDVDHDGDSH
ncbi:MAG: hypothetical protein M3Y24_08000 [Acidobacteriota bacterium]|nr:hypothetical protein [Acidobacteriota bacterium]